MLAPDITAGRDPGGYEWRPGRATTLLIAGDETAVPAATAILESLPEHARGIALLEVPHPADALAVRAPAGVDVRWLARETRVPAAEHGEFLAQTVRAWVRGLAAAPGLDRKPAGEDLPAADPDLLWEVPEAPQTAGLYAWLAGEASAVTGIRRHLVSELGVDRSRVAFMGYWRRGRAEN